ncbi:hypothetical protein IQ07DRAFT_658517 [Pyrenochaeta sp. DS3sAY3a]|nr:hypothetical protein IQ07DRAFT_658517 [Pyrenochaeta sp. DS3sAY3a]
MSSEPPSKPLSTTPPLTSAPPPPNPFAALTPLQTYTTHLSTLRSIIETDHFSNTMPPSIIDAWLSALDPSSTTPLPPGLKGFYGGDLRCSLPIELAHDSYKYVVHERDAAVVETYTARMLLSLSLLDLPALVERDATLAALALWHVALALVRREGCKEELRGVMEAFRGVRGRVGLSERKVPGVEGLRGRLLGVCGDGEARAWLEGWDLEGGGEEEG